MPTYSDGATIGARLRRLSERIDRDANQIYAQLGILFEQRWMGVLNQLDLHGALSVNELATLLAISHPSVSQTRSSLRRAGLIVERVDPKDGRRRTIHLNAKGRALVKKLSPVWEALAQAARELNAEAGDVVSALVRLEGALDRLSLGRRISTRHGGEA